MNGLFDELRPEGGTSQGIVPRIKKPAQPAAPEIGELEAMRQQMGLTPEEFQLLQEVAGISTAGDVNALANPSPGLTEEDRALLAILQKEMAPGAAEAQQKQLGQSLEKEITKGKRAGVVKRAMKSIEDLQQLYKELHEGKGDAAGKE
jgi:hypothetical protein